MRKDFLFNNSCKILNKTKKLPQLPKGIVFPKVITGIEALGRTTDRNKLIAFFMIVLIYIKPNEIQ